ncbi:MAG TPA: type I restriction endonuclease subunit M [Anaerolineae bacterium]|nr:type I restriction endonuclease subunit M [Anaerolineae bacterium]
MATFLEQALKDGHATLKGEGKNEKITYVALNHTERYNDPEEKVRAEFWAELIYRYGYEADCIGIEVVVPDRTPSDRADLVIFKDNTRKQPYAVIECKRDGISDPEFNQAVEQACGNGTWQKFRASYVMVVAGGTRRAFDFTGKYGALEREQNIIADIPAQYGKPEEFKYVKNGALDIKPVSKEELISAIKKCHQSLWEGGRRTPPEAFGELSKIIFVKISDEKNTKRGQPYQFQIKTHEKSEKLAARIKALYETQRQREPNVFTDTIKVDDPVLRTVVLHLEGINLNATDLDTKGVAFEQFMDGFFKGDFGQYFTPREVIAFAVEMLAPSHTDIVLDPACGSGGFLLYALDAVRREADEYFDQDTIQHKSHWHDFAQKRLFGIELNDSIARVAKMNMIVHDDGHTNVISVDALQDVKKIREENKGFAFNHFDIILTNPPFGAVVKKTEKAYLDGYDLDYDWKDGARSGKSKASVKTEILFLERCYQFLKPNGRMAIVLPDGILTNSSLQSVRDWLLERYRLLAVVSLPQFAFAHYGAGVKASLVFLQKREADETPNDDEAIFMAIAENIGYDATGRKTFKTFKEPKIIGDTKTEWLRCDLFDMQFIYKRDSFNPDNWVETHRQVLPETGLIAEYRKFTENPEPFFV